MGVPFHRPRVQWPDAYRQLWRPLQNEGWTYWQSPPPSTAAAAAAAVVAITIVDHLAANDPAMATTLSARGVVYEEMVAAALAGEVANVLANIAPEDVNLGAALEAAAVGHHHVLVAAMMEAARASTGGQRTPWTTGRRPRSHSRQHLRAAGRFPPRTPRLAPPSPPHRSLGGSLGGPAPGHLVKSSN